MEQTNIQIHNKKITMVKVTILVAVYNASQYIERCINSLISQTLKDIQIICIDDCSTDNSFKILKDLAYKDTRIELIHLSKNSGQAHARNEGLKQAKGQYITFVDSDDWLETDALQQAITVFDTDPNIDSVLFNVKLYYADSGKEIQYPMTFFNNMTGKDAFKESLTWNIHGWYIIKSDIHKKYPYDETCSSYSDDNTTRIHYFNSRNISCCHGTYYYFQNPDSVTHAVSMKRFEHIRANESMRNQMIALNIDKKLIDEYENTRWLVLIDTYMFYYENRKKLTQKECDFALSEMKHIWKNINTTKLKRSLKYKFGYIPLHYSWRIFCFQEEIYFMLKKILHR